MSEYGNDSIRELSEKDKIRLRPANTLGSDDINGCFHAFVEIGDNSLDEFKAGYGDKLIFTIYKDGSYSIEDFGRGVPMAWNETAQKYNYELVFAKLYSGGKYEDKKKRGYSRAKGLNGLGAASCAFSSEYFYARSYRDGHKYELNMNEGDIVGYAEGECDYEQTGTFIKWKPSKQVFTQIDIPSQFIMDYAEEQAIVNSTTIIVKNEIEENEKTFTYKNGIKDYLNKLNKGKEFTEPQYLEFKATGKDVENRKEYDSEYEIAFCFNNEEGQIKSYHNSSYLKEGGSPHDGLKSAFTYCIDKLIKDRNKYNKGEKKISYEDVSDSLLIITSTYSEETSYKNQTKFAITNEFIKKQINEKLREYLEVYFIENPMEADKIAEQIIINKRAKEKAEKTRLDIKKKLQVASTGLRPKIEGLNDCDIKNSTLEERELWLCEGLSAASTISEARDSRYMGTYALRGRFISALKNNLEDVLNNKPAIGIVQALGCGIEIPNSELKKYKDVNTFDITKLRYGKIIIACDQDFIGMGIALSLTAFFYKFMPTLLKQNRIHISISPRYEIKCKDDVLFVYGEKEKENLVEELEGTNSKYHIEIIKGLGQLNKDTYWEFVMNPEKRILKQLIHTDDHVDDIEYYFNTLAGEDIVERKKYVKKYITHLDTTLID